MDHFTLKTTLPASPKQIFEAWMTSAGHTAMTGSPAEIQPGDSAAFTAWDGYIWGTILEAVPDDHIFMAWRTSEFPEDSPDSKLEIHLKPIEGGTELTLVHSDIPDGQGQSYEQGWQDAYFTPMHAFFSKGK
jgi:activator of HSP90 ATPase